MAQFARLNAGFVEGQASQAIVNKYCNGVSDNSVPQGSQVGGNLITATVRFERGYFASYKGAKGRICKTYYSGTAHLSQGRVRFTSGTHGLERFRIIRTSRSPVTVWHRGPKTRQELRGR